MRMRHACSKFSSHMRARTLRSSDCKVSSIKYRDWSHRLQMWFIYNLLKYGRYRFRDKFTYLGVAAGLINNSDVFNTNMRNFRNCGILSLKLIRTDLSTERKISKTSPINADIGVRQNELVIQYSINNSFKSWYFRNIYRLLILHK